MPYTSEIVVDETTGETVTLTADTVEELAAAEDRALGVDTVAEDEAGGTD